MRKVAALQFEQPLQIRNRAMFIVQFHLGWRRSELVSLGLNQIELAEDSVTVRLGASKTEQEGKGRVAILPARPKRRVYPVRALRKWIEVRGNWRGPLFCAFSNQSEILRDSLSGAVVAGAVKQMSDFIGVLLLRLAG